MTQNKEIKEWAAGSKKIHLELFSELDILLRAADRFFNLENLPSVKENLAQSNFIDELSAVRDLILRVISILEVIIPVSIRNAYWFQKFAETKFCNDQRRDTLRKQLYKQDTMEKGILMLYETFFNLKGIVTDILKTNEINYLSYLNIGHILSKEIRENEYFNPFTRDINPEFDFINNEGITGIVKNIKNRNSRNYTSLILISLFRFLRYLRHVDLTNQKTISLHKSLLILMLMRSEIEIFKNYTEKIISDITQSDLKLLFQSISYQFSIEAKRVYQQELREILKKKAPRYFCGRIENSHGILKNLAEQSIVQIAQFHMPDIAGEEIFSSFIEKAAQSTNLRDDVFMLHRFLSLFMENSENPEQGIRIFEALKNYMMYFESLTFRLLRYEDYEEFSSFFQDVSSFKTDQIINGDFSGLMDKVHNFSIFLETTLRHINNRSELTDKNADTAKIDKMLKQYLANS